MMSQSATPSKLLNYLLCKFSIVSVQPCVCAMKQCHRKENCLNISSILSCEDVAKRTLNLINQ